MKIEILIFDPDPAYSRLIIIATYTGLTEFNSVIHSGGLEEDTYIESDGILMVRQGGVETWHPLAAIQGIRFTEEKP